MYDGLKLTLCAVLYHLLKGGAVVRLAADSAVDIGINYGYFDDYTKRALASGGRFKDENEVTRIENAAMLKLRRDETLKALHYAHFPDDPQDVFSHSPTPLNAVIAAENWEEWIERAAEELRGFENGL